MSTNKRYGGKWVLDTAMEIAERLRRQPEGTGLRIRLPKAAVETGTDGWVVKIGDLGKGEPDLEIWYDRFSGYPERKLYAGFHSWNLDQMERITSRVARRLWPVRTIEDSDTHEETHFQLKNRIARVEFSQPILEAYQGSRRHSLLFGFFDPTRSTLTRINQAFCGRAEAFFFDVARAMPGAKEAAASPDVYPRIENRSVVAAHLRRERSSLLAVECKIRDDHTCHVCGFRFVDFYGRLGDDFAEAHHLSPLGHQTKAILTRLEDLITVCANCHRMLHRMEGDPKDVGKLKAIVKKNRLRSKDGK